MGDLKQRLSYLFNNCPELQVLKQLICQERINAWLVGGTLRDLLLQRTVIDIDITVAENPTQLAKQFARTTGGRWFWLDHERKQSRVLLTSQLTIDFTPLRAATIAKDQALRDFTINSLAVSLLDDIVQMTLLDPLGGKNHLEQSCLEVCSERSIPDDPLRMLKGIRHAVTLEMIIGRQTLQWIKEHAPAITSVAGERVRDELGKILSSANPVAGVKMLSDTGLLSELFGRGKSDWDAAQMFIVLDQMDRQMKVFALTNNSNTEDPFSPRALFLLASLLKDYAPLNLPRLLNEKLRLSRQQQRIVLSLQQEPDQSWFDLTTEVTTARQKALLVEQLGYFPDEQLLYLAVCRAAINRDLIRELLQAYHEQQHLGRLPDLLNGHRLRELLQGQPDKEIGTWQQRIKSSELTGEICTENEAERWLKSKISD